MLKQIYYSGTVKLSSYTEKVAFYVQNFKKTERGCCKLLDAATMQRPKLLSSAQKLRR